MIFNTLISLPELATHRDDHWVIVDCRSVMGDPEGGRNAYKAGHIPGAVFMHLEEDLSGTISTGVTGRHPLPRPAEFGELLGRAGISNRSQVVAYDDKGGAIASRFWWMMKWVGHEQVAVLDGGWQAWMKEHPIETETPSPEQTTFVVSERPEMVVTKSYVDRIRLESEFVVIDARAGERYRGETEPIDPVAGHIDGAISMPFADNLTDGTFKTPEELFTRFEPVRDKLRRGRAVCYCGSGVTACHNILAANHAGLDLPRLYPGSWSEWIIEDPEPDQEEA